MFCIDLKGTGNRIKELRKKSGLSVIQLSLTLGISFQAIYRWEDGTYLPDTENLAWIALVFNTTIDDILVVRTDYSPACRTPPAQSFTSEV